MPRRLSWGLLSTARINRAIIPRLQDSDRHHPVVDFVTRLVDERRIGGLRSAQGTFAFWLTRDPDVRLDPALAGGSMWDVGCYPVSYLVHVAGAPPARVVAWQEMGPTGIDVSTHALLEFESGFIAHVESGFRTPLRSAIELVGDEAVLRVPQPFRPPSRASVTLVHDETPQTFDIDGPEPFQGEVDDLAATVLDGLPQRLTLEESGAYLATLVAIQRSAREGRAVKVACGAGAAASWRRCGGARA